jgi:hypothetical protein
MAEVVDIELMKHEWETSMNENPSSLSTYPPQASLRSRGSKQRKQFLVANHTQILHLFTHTQSIQLFPSSKAVSCDPEPQYLTCFVQFDSNETPRDFSPSQPTTIFPSRPFKLSHVIFPVACTSREPIMARNRNRGKRGKHLSGDVAEADKKTATMTRG